jgi:hypothetical protein
VNGRNAAVARGITGPILDKEWATDMPWSLNPLCPCQYGICGACDGTSDNGQPRHDRCATRQHLRHLGHPAIIHSAVTYKGSAKALLLTGCRYLCPCDCWNNLALAAPPPRRNAAAPTPDPEHSVAGMDTLFDL